MKPFRRTGFTIIELLVVLTIISVLVAMLLPAIGKAKTVAQELLCMGNIRSQFFAQIHYANDSKGRYAEHADPYPMYYRFVGANNPLGTNVWDKLRPNYLINSKVMICPLQAQWGPSHINPAYLNGSFGGWDSGATFIYGDYCWFANYSNHGNVYNSVPTPVTYLNNEPAWPANLDDSTATTAVIAHQIQYSVALNGWDYSHGSTWERFITPAPTGQSSPVAYGDAHVATHSKTDIKARATCGNTYWY